MSDDRRDYRPRVRAGSDLELLIQHWQEHKEIHPKFRMKTDKNANSLKVDLKELQKKYNAGLDHIEGLEESLGVLTELKNAKVSKADIQPKSNSDLSESIAVALLSDIHFEEDVHKEKVLGKNEYNPSIAEERLDKFFRNALFLANIQRGGTQIDTFVLALLGDMISGYIHNELIESNHLSPIHASVKVQACIKKGIDFLLDQGEFKKIIIPCCVGNHGRTTIKKNVSTSTDNSFESMIYLSLAEAFKDDSRVEFHIAKGYQLILNLWGNFKIRFHHGDAIRYGGGVGGITIPVKKAINGWNTVEKVDLDCFGHFHQLFDGGRFISNGSLIGYGEYALEIKAEYDEPKQAFFLIEKDKGKTIVAPILVR